MNVMIPPVLAVLAMTFWFVAPAYAANSFPPIVRGRRPLDRGRLFMGQRLLGDGKTIEGTATGILFGCAVGFVLFALQPAVDALLVAERAGLSLSIHTPALIVLLSIGAIFGDIVGAFIKRRLGIPRGKPAILLDQLDFLVFAFLFGSAVYAPSLSILLLLMLLTPLIHWLSNLLGYALKVKQTPW